MQLNQKKNSKAPGPLLDQGQFCVSVSVCVCVCALGGGGGWRGLHMQVAIIL